MVQGKRFGSFHLAAPLPTKSCGTFLAFIYRWIAALMRRSQRTENKQDLVTFNELARLLHCLVRAVGVVIADEVDPAAVDAALGVDLVEVGGIAAAEFAKGRGRPAVGHGIADLDFAVARAWIVLLLRRDRARYHRRDAHRCRRDQPC